MSGANALPSAHHCDASSLPAAAQAQAQALGSGGVLSCTPLPSLRMKPVTLCGQCCTPPVTRMRWLAITWAGPYCMRSLIISCWLQGLRRPLPRLVKLHSSVHAVVQTGTALPAAGCAMLHGTVKAEPGRQAVSLLTGMRRQTQLPLPQDASCCVSQPDATTPAPDAAASQRLLDKCLCQVYVVASDVLLCLKASPLFCKPCLPP